MLGVSSVYRALMQAPVKTVRVELAAQDTGAPSFSSSDDVASVKLEAGAPFLGAAARRLVVRLVSEQPALVGKKYRLRVGLEKPTGGYEYVSYGDFTVSKAAVDYARGSTTLTLDDVVMAASNASYGLTAGDFPCTVKELAEKVGAWLNVPVVLDSGLPNAGHRIDTDLWAKIHGFTMRQLLAQIAQATGTTCRVSNDGGLEFRVFEQVADNTLTKANLLRVKRGRRFGKINSVVLSRLPQNDNITLQNQEGVNEFGVQEVKIVNNEILDDDRQTLIQPLFRALVGNYLPNLKYMDELEVTTEGHGVYEVGDMLNVDLGGGVIAWLYVNSVSLIIDGGIKEVLKCTPPDPNKTDYLTAGGVTQTIWNTEIKTDRQGQQITAVVSRQDTTEGLVQQHYTELKQDIRQVQVSVQSAGGVNLIKNSVGYARDKAGKLVDWAQSGTVTSRTSPDSRSAGAISGNAIVLRGNSSVTQRVFLAPSTGDLSYTLGLRIRKPSVGVVRIEAVNGSDNFSRVLPTGQEVVWGEVLIENVNPTAGFVDIRITTDSAVAEDVEVTDLYLVVGGRSPWTQAAGEVLNTNVSVNDHGMQVRSNVYGGDYVEITPLEFAGYSSASGQDKKVFGLNRETTFVHMLLVDKQIDIPPIKMVAIPEGSKAGLSFVKRV